MNIKLICVGKLKEKYWRDACTEYSKRLSRFCKLSILEIPDEATPDNANDTQITAILNKEGEKILSNVRENEYLVSLCIEGIRFDSVGFSQKMNEIMLSGKSQITFVIGGSCGLSDEVKKRSNLKLSFSDMTFPHQLMRIILLEQVYRGFKILGNESYHK